MPVHEAIKADWTTPEILIEGSLNCAKTTLFLDKEIDAVFRWPRIKSFLFRWAQDAVDTKLKPAFEEILQIREIVTEWDAKEKCFLFENGSKVYMFGLKAASLVEQYNKIRGLGASRIGGDQVEEVAPQVGGELRGRLRPTLRETVQGLRYPFQLTFVSNSEDDEFWLSKEFPVDNHVKGRKVFQLSVFDNKHLPQESIDSLLRQYPAEHPKHQTAVLGRRGPSITGVPIYEGIYVKEHHHREVFINPSQPILESFEVGKHNPTWIYGQRLYDGALTILGGIRAQEMVLEDFLPIVKRYRSAWIPEGSLMKTCTSPVGMPQTLTRSSFSTLDILKKAGFTARYNERGNSPDVRLAVIEDIAGYLRRNDALVVSNDLNHWRLVSKDGEKPSPLAHIALEAGYTWDKHFVSVGSKEVRQPTEDDKFANVMHCVENIVLNFCSGQLTPLERASKKAEARRAWGAQEPNERTSMDYAK